MLVLLGSNDDVVVETLIHVWYSACLERRHVDILRSAVLPLVEDVVRKIQHVDDDRFLCKRIRLGSVTLTITLMKPQWTKLLAKLAFDLPRSFADQRRQSITLGRRDHIQRLFMGILYDCHKRLARLRFRETGILLPFGMPVESFEVANS